MLPSTNSLATSKNGCITTRKWESTSLCGTIGAMDAAKINAVNGLHQIKCNEMQNQ
jgi:hypothetical protein